MSACCDGSLGDSCPCDCHNWVTQEDLREEAVEDMAAWWEEVQRTLRATMDLWLGTPEPPHPLLDPAVPRPELTAREEVPPVDPARVKRLGWPG